MRIRTIYEGSTLVHRFGLVDLDTGTRVKGAAAEFQMTELSDEQFAEARQNLDQVWTAAKAEHDTPEKPAKPGK